MPPGNIFRLEKLVLRRRTTVVYGSRVRLTRVKASPAARGRQPTKVF